MYDNIGVKIKNLAKWTFIAEAIASIVTGIALLVVSKDLWYLLILLFGPIVAWVSSWVLYGFGELIEKVTEIERTIHIPQKKATFKRVCEIENLYQQGLISEEDYLREVSKK